MEKNKSQKTSILLIIGFSIIILSITVFMALKNTGELNNILEESIKSQLISISIAARGILDVDKFDSYNSIEDINNDIEFYEETRTRLRSLQEQVGAEYIYALKLINGKYYFVFDTDYEDEAVFIEYEIYPVHERAFLGEESAGVMNVVDEYGNFNSGAVPILKNGKVIGIISTDIEDTYIQESNQTAFNNYLILILSLVITIGTMIVIISLLLKNINKIQDKLFRMANYDVLTGLPNRQYLMSYLTTLVKKTNDKQVPFALLLIDLDNFKKVNDNAGHDAGDELLRHIAAYLESIHENSKQFRPAAGILNVSARIGGDEFVQVIPGISTEDELQMVIKKLLDNFSSNTLDHYIEKYQVGMSIGAALFPYHSENYNVLIKFADMAMYYAKNSGKNTYCIYNEELNNIIDELPKKNNHTDRRRNRG